MPPNISLNVYGGSVRVELVSCAFIAASLQSLVLVWSGYLANSPPNHRLGLSGSKPVVGFSLQAVGTLLLTMSLILCARIINKSTHERHWWRGEPKTGDPSVKSLPPGVKPSSGKCMRLFWIQKQHTAGDHHFAPYLLYCEELREQIFESHPLGDEDPTEHKKRLRKKEKRTHFRTFKMISFSSSHLTTFAVISGLLGFVAQFQGLRFCNWSCSIAQLAALSIASVLLAWLRRGMTRRPVAIPAHNEYLLDQLAFAIAGNGSAGSTFLNFDAFPSLGISFASGVLNLPKLREQTNMKRRFRTSQVNSTTDEGEPVQVENSFAQRVLNLRIRLGQFTKWMGSGSEEASNLSKSIEVALEGLSPDIPGNFEGSTMHKSPPEELGSRTSENFEVPARHEAQYRVVLKIQTDLKSCYLSQGCRRGSWDKDKLRTEDIELKIVKNNGYWKVDDAQLEALLSLISYSDWNAQQSTTKQSIKKHWPTRSSGKGDIVSETYHHLICPKIPKLPSELYWWIPKVQYKLKMIDCTQGDPEKSAIISQACGSTEGKGGGGVAGPIVGCCETNKSEETKGVVIESYAVLTSLIDSGIFWSF